MSWGFVAVGGAMVIGSIIQADASKKAGEAAQGAANAQLSAAQANAGEIKAIGTKTQEESMKLAQATPEELGALGSAYSAADNALKREQRLIDSIDPNIMEANKQALAILRGQSAESNKPLMDMRNSQRGRLVSQLREQYGPGAELSSLGQKALQQFDLESNVLFQQNQQGTLSQLFGIGTTDVGNRLTRGASTLQQVGQGYSALQERILNTRINTGNALSSALAGANASVIQNSGAPYVGAAVAAQGQQAIGQSFTNAAGMGLGGLLSKPAAPATQPGGGGGGGGSTTTSSNWIPMNANGNYYYKS